MTKTTPPTPAADQPPRRPTPTERYHELALSIAARTPQASEHSLELTRNARGDVQIALTGRGVDLDELERDVTGAFDRLCEKYPRVDHPNAGGKS